MKIYTKNGDKGFTKLGNGLSVSKSHPWIKCYGAIDELNSWIGMICSERHFPDNLKEKLQAIQSQLFYLGADLCKSHQKYDAIHEDTRKLEEWIDYLESQAEPIRNFILPGGFHLASIFHVIRTVCRRAEVELVEAARTETIDKYQNPITYLNRLSDLFFCLARYWNNQGRNDVVWQPKE